MFCYRRIHKTQIKIARIFNTFGPFMRIDDGRVVSNLIVQALTNKPLTIYGDGTQTRSFCYIDDLVNGLVKLMGSDPSVTGPINLGNPVEISMNRLAEIILKITDSNSKISYLPLPADDPKIRFPDISKAKKVLNWSPTVDLEQGLRMTVASFKERI
jgi:UDP-glucuronate decarboxylase